MPKRKKRKPAEKLPAEVRQRENWITMGLCGLLFMLTLLAYIPAFSAGYVEFDDQIYIRENLHVSTGLTWDNVVWAFTEVGFASNWHPLTWISHMLDAELFGTEPAGHHVMNVIIHCANSILLFMMLRFMTGHVMASFLVAGLFAVHPLNVESVAWLAQRKNTLSTFFGILAIWAYSHYTNGRNWPAYAISILCFALSLLAKPMLVTLPFGLLLLDYWPLRRAQLQTNLPETGSSGATPAGQAPSLKQLVQGGLKLLPEKLPYFAMSAAVIALTLLAQKTAINPLDKYPLSERLSNVSVSYVEYLWLMVWPVKLAVFYPLFPADITTVKLLGSIALLTAITVGCIYLRGSMPYLLVGWLWYLGTMVPVIGIVHVGQQALADRYAYVPFWGLWIAIVWACVDGCRRLFGAAAALRVVGSVAAVVLIAFAYLANRQSARWQDTVSLFESAVENTSKNWLAHKILANHYLATQDLQRCLWHCDQTRSWGREYPMIYSTQGRALFEMGSRESGLELLLKAIQWYPEVSLYRANLGWVYVEMGRYDEAIEQLTIADSLLTSEDSIYARRIVNGNWGVALAQQGKYDESLVRFEAALAREPENTELLRSAAKVDIKLQQYDRARERLIRILRNDSGDVPAFELLASTFVAENNWPEAAATYQALIQLIPYHFNARLILADLMIKLQQNEAARQQLQSLIEELSGHEDPKVTFFLSQVHSKLATTFALIGDFQNARLSATAALELANRIQDEHLIEEAKDRLAEYQDK